MPSQIGHLSRDIRLLDRGNSGPTLQLTFLYSISLASTIPDSPRGIRRRRTRPCLYSCRHGHRHRNNRKFTTCKPPRVCIVGMDVGRAQCLSRLRNLNSIQWDIERDGGILGEGPPEEAVAKAFESFEVKLKIRVDTVDYSGGYGLRSMDI
jgi:hypothetical protein